MKYLLPLLLLLPGCAQIDKIPDDQLAHDLNVAAVHGVSFLLKAALKKYPADAAKITADAKLADTILQKTVIPLFAGNGTAQVLRSAVDTALAALKSQIKDQRVIESIDIGVELVLLNVNLPQVPTAALDGRTIKILNGIATGMSTGIEMAFPAAAPAPAPARDPLTIPK